MRKGCCENLRQRGLNAIDSLAEEKEERCSYNYFGEMARKKGKEEKQGDGKTARA